MLAHVISPAMIEDGLRVNGDRDPLFRARGAALSGLGLFGLHPVSLSREFGPKGPNSLGPRGVWRSGPEIVKFRVLFPFSGEFESRDGFETIASATNILLGFLKLLASFAFADHRNDHRNV
jgi:hypothetical protein